MTPRFLLAFCLFAGLVSGCASAPPQLPVALILDTDMETDVDDVGALVVLHALADRGEAKLLAVMVSSANPWSGRCARSVNRFYNRPEVPVGVARHGVVMGSSYARQVAEEFGEDTTAPLPEAVSLYRRLLAAQPDRSVTIVSVGYLTNLAALLRSPPDRQSPLDGAGLVQQKVKLLVCMGGQYPQGREWNFYQDAPSARYVVAAWPARILFVGYEAGKDILTGDGLRQQPPSPLRRAYELYNNLTDRPSWDQLAVLVAVRRKQGATKKLWHFVSGKNSVAADGSNRWSSEGKAPHEYLAPMVGAAVFGRAIEALMVTKHGADNQESRVRQGIPLMAEAATSREGRSP